VARWITNLTERKRADEDVVRTIPKVYVARKCGQRGGGQIAYDKLDADVIRRVQIEEVELASASGSNGVGIEYSGDRLYEIGSTGTGLADEDDVLSEDRLERVESSEPRDGYATNRSHAPPFRLAERTHTRIHCAAVGASHSQW